MDLKKLPAVFYKNANGREPVRDWLKRLPVKDRKAVGLDIKTVEFGWPVGMPLCRAFSSHKGIKEIRSHVSDGRIARLLFFEHQGMMVLLHGFIKKTQATPKKDLDLAIQRIKEVIYGE